MKEIIRNLSLSLISILIFFLSVEVFARIFFPQEIGLYQKSNTLGIKFTPNYKKNINVGGWYTINVNINSIGLRDREFGKKEKGVFRILVAGDSQTFGLGVETNNTYSKILENLLNKNITQKKFEVVNAGVNNYGTIQELQYLKESGFSLNPDLILTGLFIGNDFNDNAVFEKLFIRKKRYNSVELFLISRSHAYIFFKKRYMKLLAIYNMRIRSKFKEILPVRLLGKDFYFPNQMEFCKKAYTVNMEEAMNLTKKTILEMTYSAKTHNSKILFIIIPTRQQFDEADWVKSTKAYNLDVKDYDIFKPNNLLSQFMKKNRITVIDMLPVFKKFGEDKELYYREGHLNNEGHRIIGTEIYKALIDYNLIPKE